MSLYVGVDVGGTTSTVVVGDAEGNVLCVSDQFPTRSVEGPDSTIADIVGQIGLELNNLGRDVSEVTRISLATPGPATRDGVLLSTPNLDPRLWDRCPIRHMFEAAWAKTGHAVPVDYIGDGQAAALGEFAVRTGQIQWAGSPQDATGDSFDSLFMVAVGTGLGGGEVRGGRAVQGSRGRAGHAGHLMLPVAAFRHEHDRQLKVG